VKNLQDFLRDEDEREQKIVSACENPLGFEHEKDERSQYKNNKINKG